MEYKRICRNCNKEFVKNKATSLPAWFGNEKYPEGTKFCSRECSSSAQIGRQAYNKGVPGKKWTPEIRGKITKFWKEKRKLNTNYKKSGGVWQTVRKWVFERDNYTCVICSFSEKEIMKVDHIQPQALFPHLRYDMDNCQTLCPNCEARKTVEDKKYILKIKKQNLI